VIIQFLAAIARAAFRPRKQQPLVLVAPSAVDVDLRTQLAAVESKVDMLTGAEAARQAAA